MGVRPPPVELISVGIFKVTCVRCTRERAFCVCGSAPNKAIKRNPPQQPKPKR